MRRLIWLPIGGFLLIAGAAIAAAAPTTTPISTAALNAASPAPTAAASPVTNTDGQANDQPPYFQMGKGLWAGQDGLLTQVLSDLVSQGVITQEQSDAITSALQTKIDDQRTLMEQQRQQMQETWAQMQGFLEDGVITQDEIDQLPADSSLRSVFDSIAKDGQVTLDQLRQLGPGFGHGMGPGMGHGMGHGMGPGRGPWSDDSTTNPDASPSTGTTTNS